MDAMALIQGGLTALGAGTFVWLTATLCGAAHGRVVLWRKRRPARVAFRQLEQFGFVVDDYHPRVFRRVEHEPTGEDYLQFVMRTHSGWIARFACSGWSGQLHDWNSPTCPTPIAAYTAAQLVNWGQATPL